MTLEETKTDLKELGFQGFVTIDSLFKNSSVLPKVKGVYMILYPSAIAPKFRTIGSGGHFKERNPNVSLQLLQDNWVADTAIVYIGKAGSESASATLQSRLKQYLNFGQGKAVGHWGGRLIWQLQLAEELIVCWKTTPQQEPSVVESYLIEKFKDFYKKRPFANLRD
jgi:hypothetical protein